MEVIRVRWKKFIAIRVLILAMKSAQINEYGGSEVIKINQSTPEPTISSGKVLVTIKAAGVNPADWKIREGYFLQMASLQFPSTLGMDFSGVIKQIGEGYSTSDFNQGDEVYGQAGVVTGGQEHLQKWLWQRLKILLINPSNKP